MAMDAREGKLAQYGVLAVAPDPRAAVPRERCKGTGSARPEPELRIHPTHPALCPMPKITSLAKFTVPLGGQDIELQEVVHDAGGMRLLRVRIRERSRFTIFDVDPVTAQRWGEAMRNWGAAQPKGEEAPPAGPIG